MGWNPLDEATSVASDPQRAFKAGANTSVDPGGVNSRLGGGFTGGISGLGDRGGRAIGKIAGFDTTKQRDAEEQARQLAEQQGRDTQGVLNGMNKSDAGYLQTYHQNNKDYQNASAAAARPYLQTLQANQAAAADQAKNAKTVYSNDIQPRLKQSMEDAQREAGSAMTLAEAGDPNNKTATAVRNLYDTTGQGIRKQGLADYGVLAALGTQATGNTLGAAGGPVTGAQLGQIQGVNQRNASMAYTNAAKRMQDLQEQGIGRSLDESSKQYDRGVAAKGAYNNSIGNYEGGMDRDIARQQGLRDIDMGYSSDQLGVERGLAGENYNMNQGYDTAAHDISMGQGNRQIGQINNTYGAQQAGIANQIAQANAENAQRTGLIGGAVTGGLTALGASQGGAPGAMAGATAGNGIANGLNRGNQNNYQPYQPSNAPAYQAPQNRYSGYYA